MNAKIVKTRPVIEDLELGPHICAGNKHGHKPNLTSHVIVMEIKTVGFVPLRVVAHVCKRCADAMTPEWEKAAQKPCGKAHEKYFNSDGDCALCGPKPARKSGDLDQCKRDDCTNPLVHTVRNHRGPTICRKGSKHAKFGFCILTLDHRGSHTDDEGQRFRA